ncbi:MAG: hypothetical protein GXO62_04580 [Epsilonproteobacteria bacterium]|nr:hypothetical protein [Campylobacterota bacterium]
MKSEKLKVKSLWLFFLFFTGCSVKEKPIYAVIKTPTIKIADQGFIKEGRGYKEIVIYKAGLEPLRMVIKNSTVCIQKRCFSKEAFVRRFLGEGYESDIFDKILNKEPIKLKKSWRYIRGKNRVLFKSKDVLIMIKDLK